MSDKCYLEKLGGCCCKCQYSIPIHKHPLNNEVGNGMMSDLIGYACIGFFSVDERVAHFFETKHGMCELFKPQSVINDTLSKQQDK